MPRGLPRGEGHAAPAVNACTAAVFFMGFNLGLTILLAVVLATHSPAAFSAPLDPPPYLRAQGVIGGGSGAVVVDASNGFTAHSTDVQAQVETIVRPSLPSMSSGIERASPLFNLEPSTPMEAVKHRPPCVNSTKTSSAARSSSLRHNKSSEGIAAADANHSSSRIRSSRSSFHRLPSAAFMARRRHEAEASCRARPRGCKVYYVHVHKSGGTTLCSMAGTNGLRVKVATNCLQRESSSRLGSKPVAFWQWSTSEQRQWLLSQPVDFIANEGGSFDLRTAPWPQGLAPWRARRSVTPAAPAAQEAPRPPPEEGTATPPPPPPLLQGLVYVLTVRNPLDRVLSHYRHERASPKPHNPLVGTSFGSFLRAPGFVHWRSEFYVRLLGGCGWLPQCSSEEHLALAVRTLDFFSAVLVTDDATTFAAGATRVLAPRLGWDPATSDPSDPKLRRGTRVNSRAASELAHDPQGFNLLASYNILDLAFHEAATERFHAQLMDELSKTLQGTPTNRGVSQQSEAKANSLSSNVPSAPLLDQLLSGREGSTTSNGADTAQKPQDSRLMPPDLDRSGFGGHTDRCKGLGAMPLDDCRAALLKANARGNGGCNELSYKDGQCYLHRTQQVDFYTDTSMGHLTQRGKTSVVIGYDVLGGTGIGGIAFRFTININAVSTVRLKIKEWVSPLKSPRIPFGRIKEASFGSLLKFYGHSNRACAEVKNRCTKYQDEGIICFFDWQLSRKYV